MVEGMSYSRQGKKGWYGFLVRLRLPFSYYNYDYYYYRYLCNDIIVSIFQYSKASVIGREPILGKVSIQCGFAK